MIIRCPQCASTYEIAGSTQVLGKKVRCTQCTHVWRVEAIEEAPPAPAITEAGDSASEASAETAGSGEPLPDIGDTADLPGTESAEAEVDDRDEVFEDTSDRAAAQPAQAAPERLDTTSRREPAGRRPTATAPLPPPATSRPSRQRPDRYSLDPFDEPRPLAASTAAAGVAAPGTSFSDSGATRTAAERRIERERSYANGHPNPNAPSRVQSDPVRPKPRQADASWERQSQHEDASDFERQDRPAGDFDEPVAAGRGSRMGVVLGWLALVAVLAGGAMFALFSRETVVQVLPGAAPVYASLGMPVNRRGLEFRDVTYTWTVDGKGRPAIDIGGEIENVSAAPVMVPTVVFAFQDEEGLELFHWATPVRRSPLPPGKRSKFQARIPAPPEAVRNLQLRFARAR